MAKLASCLPQSWEGGREGGRRRGGEGGREGGREGREGEERREGGKDQERALICVSIAIDLHKYNVYCKADLGMRIGYET